VDCSGRYYPSTPTVDEQGLLVAQEPVTIPMAKKFARRSPVHSHKFPHGPSHRRPCQGRCRAAAIPNSMPKTGPCGPRNPWPGRRPPGSIARFCRRRRPVRTALTCDIAVESSSTGPRSLVGGPSCAASGTVGWVRRCGCWRCSSAARSGDVWTWRASVDVDLLATPAGLDTAPSWLWSQDGLKARAAQSLEYSVDQ
jgi:hypothetical protein